MIDRPDQQETAEIEMNAAGLYVEETFTDNRVGTIRRMTPVTTAGEPDATRAIKYMGSAQIMTPAGALPLSFEISADSLGNAVAGFGDAAKQAVEQTMNELREMQRQQASSIVVPGSGMGPQGGMGGGGIQMR